MKQHLLPSRSFLKNANTRLVVMREKTNDPQFNIFTGDNHKYRCILTNDWQSDEKEFVEYHRPAKGWPISLSSGSLFPLSKRRMVIFSNLPKKCATTKKKMRISFLKNSYFFSSSWQVQYSAYIIIPYS